MDDKNVTKEANLLIDEETIESTNEEILKSLYIPKSPEELEALLNEKSQWNTILALPYG